ncbi:MAG: TPM domain-containing protein [Ornithinimicrobium sp.]
MALVVAVLVVLISPLAALAEDPLDVPGQIYDSADVLSGDETDIEDAMDSLADERGLQLFVAFVDTFEGAGDNSGAEWAEATFAASGMGGDDVLLAVAVQDRKYGTYTSNDSGLTSDQVLAVENDFILPALGDDDWSGAAIAAAEGFAQTDPDAVEDGESLDATGEETSVLGNDSGFDFPWFFAVPIIGFGLALFFNWRGNKAARGGSGVATNEAPGPAGMPTQELQANAAAALVDLDNALRSADEELAFAQAQFGEQRTQRFSEVLKEARAQSQEAFRIRAELDDADPEPEPVARTMLSQIIEIATAADAALASHTQEFADLRSLEARVPQFLEELAARIPEVNRRLPAAEQQLRGLAARYPAKALGTVRANVKQAARLIDSADGFVEAGQVSVERQDRSSAVAAARASEESLAQATRLLDQIDRAGQDLDSSTQALAAAITSITSDITDAGRLAPADASVKQSVQQAREAVRQGQQARQGGDPLAALAMLDDAEHDLDTVLESFREADAARDKARSAFQARVERVGARLRSIDETISTRRGAVDSSARTRMSEAMRLFGQAQSAYEEDPAQAASLLNQAEQAGERALAQASSDIDRWDDPGSPGMRGGGMGGGMFGPGGRRGRSQGIDIGSVILGGILAGGGSRHSGGWGGHRGGGNRGGFGGGGFGGGGSFGGGGGISSGGRF